MTVTATAPFPDSRRDHAPVPDGNDPGCPESAAELRCELDAERKLTTQLRAALASRSVIDQAIGIIMAEQRCTAQQAFEILRIASQNRNAKLRHVAADVITNLTGRPPQPPPFRLPGQPRLSGRDFDHPEEPFRPSAASPAGQRHE
jgi:ANTAR domain